MTLADIAFWTLIIIGFGLCFLAYWLAAVALAPALVGACGEHHRQRPIAATAIGVGALLPTLVIAIAISQHLHGPGGFIAILMLSTAGLLALLGSAGLAQRIGTGLAMPADPQQPWRPALRGALVLLGIFLAPFLGWFVVMPWVLISGLGAALMTLLSRRRGAPGQPVAAPILATATAAAP
jgi:hypothetical protein